MQLAAAKAAAWPPGCPGHLQVPQHAVLAPGLCQLNGGAPQLPRVLLQLCLQPLKQRQPVGGTACKEFILAILRYCMTCSNRTVNIRKRDRIQRQGGGGATAACHSAAPAAGAGPASAPRTRKAAERAARQLADLAAAVLQHLVAQRQLRGDMHEIMWFHYYSTRG